MYGVFENQAAYGHVFKGIFDGIVFAELWRISFIGIAPRSSRSGSEPPADATTAHAERATARD